MLSRFHRLAVSRRSGGPASLETRSHRPHRRRQPTWTVELAERVLRLWQQYPRWGKHKLTVLLRREGRSVSPSRAGRILSRLKARRRPRSYAWRKPGD